MRTKRGWLALIMCVIIASALIPAVSSMAADAPRTVTLASTLSFAEDYFDWEIMTILQDDLNIKIDYNFYDRDKFQLMLAGGDLTDLVTGTQEYLPSIIQNGLALNLDTVAEKLPFLNGEIFQARNDLARLLMGGEEHALYFALPGLGPERVGAGKIPGRGYTIRWDYYKEIGAPPINNDEDYLNAFIEIQKLHPTKEDGSPMYAIAQWNELYRFYMRAAYLKEVALNPWTFNNYLFMAGVDDCILYDGYIDTDRSAFWTDMKFYNQLYRHDMFDLDSFTMTIDDWTAKMRSATYYGEVYNYNVLYNEMVKSDPNTLAGNVVVPSEGAVVHANKLNLAGNAPNNYIFVSKNSKNIDAALEALDYLHDPDYIRTVFTGVKGKEWDYDENGLPVMFQSTIDRRSLNDADWQKTGFGRGTTAHWNMAQPTSRHPDGYSYDLMEEPVNRALGLAPLYVDFDSFYDAVYPGEPLTKLVEEGKTIDLSNEFAQTVAIGLNDIPMDIKRIMDECNNIIYNSLPEIIMASSDEEFAAIQARVIEDVLSVDEQTAWEWCETEFNRVREIVEPIFKDGYAYYEKEYLGK